MTQAKSSKLSRRAERREREAEPEQRRSQSTSDLGARTSDTSEPERPGTTTQVIRDRNLRLREQAAAQRRSKRERERRTVTASGLDAGERVDDALARSTHAVVVWLKRHYNVVQWVVVLFIVAGVAWQIYNWRSKKTRARDADMLAEGLSAELGRVQNPVLEDEEEKDYPSVLPSFPDEAARLSTAAKEYKEAVALTPTSGPGRLAELGLASVLFQQGKFDEASSRYRDVAAGPLAKNDPDVRGRALEGMGLCLESKKDFDGALRQFGRLANLDQPEFKALGLYHEARVYFLKGDREKAKERLGKARAQVDKLVKSDQEQRSYLAAAVRALATAIDPTAAAAGLSAEQPETLRQQLAKDPQKLQRLLEDIKRGALPRNSPALPESEQAPGEPSEPSSAPPPTQQAPTPAADPTKAKAAPSKSAAKAQGAMAPKASGSATPSSEPPPTPTQPVGSESRQP